MDAKKCDRCGNFYEINDRSDKPNKIVTYCQINCYGHRNEKYRDICPDCMKYFERWMKNEQTFT